MPHDLPRSEPDRRTRRRRARRLISALTALRRRRTPDDFLDEDLPDEPYDAAAVAALVSYRYLVVTPAGEDLQQRLTSVLSPLIQADLCAFWRRDRDWSTRTVADYAIGGPDLPALPVHGWISPVHGVRRICGPTDGAMPPYLRDDIARNAFPRTARVAAVLLDPFELDATDPIPPEARCCCGHEAEQHRAGPCGATLPSSLLYYPCIGFQYAPGENEDLRSRL